MFRQRLSIVVVAVAMVFCGIALGTGEAHATAVARPALASASLNAGDTYMFTNNSKEPQYVQWPITKGSIDYATYNADGSIYASSVSVDTYNHKYMDIPAGGKIIITRNKGGTQPLRVGGDHAGVSLRKSESPAFKAQSFSAGESYEFTNNSNEFRYVQWPRTKGSIDYATYNADGSIYASSVSVDTYNHKYMDIPAGGKIIITRNKGGTQPLKVGGDHAGISLRKSESPAFLIRSIKVGDTYEFTNSSKEDRYVQWIAKKGFISYVIYKPDGSIEDSNIACDTYNHKYRQIPAGGKIIVTRDEGDALTFGGDYAGFGNLGNATSSPASPETTTTAVFPLPTDNGKVYKTNVLDNYSTGYNGGKKHGTYIFSLKKSAGDYTVMDIKAGRNTPVLAVMAGTIVRNRYDKVGGNYVEIKHDDGSTSYYGHLNEKPKWTEGNSVSTGEQIGLVGNSGADGTGVHLHFIWSGHDPYCEFHAMGFVEIAPNSGASEFPHKHN